MTKCKILPQDFIKDCFTPQIGVLCSNSAEDICKKNNLNFIELLQPFCKLTTDVQYKDPTGNVIVVHNIKVSLIDVNSKPPDPIIARKYLNSSVSQATWPKFEYSTICDCLLNIPTSAPWFEAWRQIFFEVQYPTDHEFTKHFLACMLVISSNESNPVDSMAQLTQALTDMQNASISKLPKWFNDNILKYYIVIHDEIANEHLNVLDVFNNLKTIYGDKNCFLLRTNSRNATGNDEYLPDPWSQFIKHKIQTEDSVTSILEQPSNLVNVLSKSLEVAQEANEVGTTLTYHPLSPQSDENLIINATRIDSDEISNVSTLHGALLSTDDIEQLKMLIHDFCTQSLVPFIEKQILSLHDIISNKKGVSKSLFSATKRWFTPHKPTSNSATINTLTYPPDAPELHIRRLGDIYFMFGHYSAAFQAYHTAKRDFMADQAWLYYAGALEMAALSAFMANESTRKTFDYMEESITTYLNICKMEQFATRATLLSTECLKGHNMYGEAAHQLIRMTSEESDLRSALLLEQAAYCFLVCTRPCMVRKYAFHCVLAGHRYSKSGQRKHSLRCYKQAYQVYHGKGWNLTEDHIYYTIGRQANNLGKYHEAVESYTRLLTAESKQSAHQQAVFLKEYLTIHRAYLQKLKVEIANTLPIPIIQMDGTKVLVGPTVPLRMPGKVPALGISLSNDQDIVSMKRWNKLEEMLVHEAQGSLPMIFKPLVTLFTGDESILTKPIAIVGEPIQVSVQLYNPLQIILNLKEIYLVWEFTNAENCSSVSNQGSSEQDDVVKTHQIKLAVLQANATQEVVLSITPLIVGEIWLKGMCYSLVSSSNADNEIKLRGTQSFEGYDCIKSEKHLKITIVPSAPCLQVSFCEMNSELLRNELQQMTIELRNVGSVNLHQIFMATSKPELLSSCNQHDKDILKPDDLDSAAIRDQYARKIHTTHITLPDGTLEPGQFHNDSMWIKAPTEIGSTTIDLLIYYENVNAQSVPRYRLVRHVWQLTIQESVKLDVATKASVNTNSIAQLALIVKAMNMNKPHHAILTEITLVKLCMLSQQWVLDKSCTIESNNPLKSQESTSIFARVYRNVSNKTNFSEIVIDDVSMKKMSDQQHTAFLDFAKRQDYRFNVFDNVSDTSDAESSSDAVVILVWRAVVTDSSGRQRFVYGQNQVPINVLILETSRVEDYDNRPSSFTNSQYSLTERARLDNNVLFLPEDKLITFNLRHVSLIKHNFNTKKLCVIPIQIIIHNNVNIPIILKLETIGTSRSDSNTLMQPPGLFYPFSSNNFRWIQTGSTIRELNAYASTIINLSVAILSIGTYDLGSRIEILCHDAHNSDVFVQQICRAQSSLIIVSGNG